MITGFSILAAFVILAGAWLARAWWGERQWEKRLEVAQKLPPKRRDPFYMRTGWGR